MIRIENISHYYDKNQSLVLKNINACIEEKKFVVLIGNSGSGKTTLLNIIAGLMKPTAGKIIYNDVNICSLNDKNISEFRSENIGFVFQNYFLEKSYSAIENVMVPLFLNKKIDAKKRYDIALSMLEVVGLKDKAEKKPTELSGGECQRISIARALVNNPKVIIADEPTGNLDSVNGMTVINLLKEQVELGKTVIMVTHNLEYVKFADQVLKICDGMII